MNIRAVFAGLKGAIQDASPMTWGDRGFASEPGSLIVDPETWVASPARQLRDFALRVTSYPTSANAYCFFELAVEVLVYYPAGLPTDELQAMLIEDAVTIQHAVGRVPSAWGGAESVSFLGQQPYIWTTAEDDSGMVIGSVFAVPFMIVVRVS